METIERNIWRIASALIVLSSFVLILWVIRPSINKTVQMNMERIELLERVEGALEWENRLHKIENEQAAIDAFLTDVQVEMPGDYLMSTLIENFFSIAGERSVSIRRLEPMDREETETYIRIPFQIQCSGTYHNLIRMLNDLERLGYWLNPESILLQSDRIEDSHILEATLFVGILQLKTVTVEDNNGQ